ncbi:globin domain-containing protein [Phaeobacter sp.]|uniref:globin domain-containing protein n=1 Tax=Phaeobacter sp. TaxID=1902409 RepID=UPI0025EED07B|nr:globin domain-containing protein [Phaeobacter sp.]
MSDGETVLTNGERNLILQNVNSEKMDLDRFVPLFYSKFFAACPDTRSMFPADMSQQEEKLLVSLTHIIEAVDHPEKLEMILRNQGKKHRDIEITDAHFDGFIVSFITALADTLEEEWNADACDAWHRFLHYIAHQMNFKKAA